MNRLADFKLFKKHSRDGFIKIENLGLKYLYINSYYNRIEKLSDKGEFIDILLLGGNNRFSKNKLKNRKITKIVMSNSQFKYRFSKLWIYRLHTKRS